MSDLTTKHCLACEGGVQPLTQDVIDTLASQIPKWAVDDQQQCLSRTFAFNNYYQTIAFVNAIAWIAHHEDHHPDLQVSYNRCSVSYTTHAINGLSENDFICAAKVDTLCQQK